jgi:hypothetical protein
VRAFGSLAVILGMASVVLFVLADLGGADLPAAALSVAMVLLLTGSQLCRRAPRQGKPPHTRADSRGRSA